MKRRFLLALIAVASSGQAFAQDECEPCIESRPSWVFQRSTYTHDPLSGARVAQYDRVPPVEDLDDPRAVTSSYRRTRTNIRGADGSIDSYYQVQSWNNDRGGIDAQWERFHDAWRESITVGSYFNSTPRGFYGPGYGYPGHYGGPGYGYHQPPQYGVPPYGQPPRNAPHFRQRHPDFAD